MNEMTFKALFDHSSIGIIISNTEGTIEKCNRHAAQIFGYAEDELIGQKVEILLPHSLRERHVGYRKEYINNPKPRMMGGSLNLEAMKKDGGLFRVEVSLSYFNTEKGLNVVSFINDITERFNTESQVRKFLAELESKVKERTKELSDALIELNNINRDLNDEMEQRKKVELQIRNTLEREKELSELKSRFVSMASHEFRTPLSSILTSASLISKYVSNEDEPKRAKHVSTIKKSVKSLTSILNDFLSLDRLNQGKVESHPTSFSLDEFLRELVDEMQELSDKEQKIVIFHRIPDLVLSQDIEMFRNVVINLISNAMKYSPVKSLITLETDSVEGKLKLVVKDQGIGIPQEDQKHLFELFFRANNAITIKGTGLGLNIVKRYLDLMNGSIEFSSEKDKGTTFIVTLPLEI